MYTFGRGSVGIGMYLRAMFVFFGEQDHYENLFLVVSGEKRFCLRPPCDVTSVVERSMAAATYAPSSNGGLEAVLDSPPSSVSWVVNDVPDESDNDVLLVVVQPGEMLYLPSLWYHAVRQSGRTVAVNWWHDMNFCSPSYVYYNALRDLSAPDQCA